MSGRGQKFKVLRHRSDVLGGVNYLVLRLKLSLGEMVPSQIYVVGMTNIHMLFLFTVGQVMLVYHGWILLEERFAAFSNKI